MKNNVTYTEGYQEEPSKSALRYYYGLKKLNFPVCLEFPVGVWRIDIAIPDKKIAIEVDGLFKENLSAYRKNKDQKRETELRRLGWDVIRTRSELVWDKDFQSAIDVVANRIRNSSNYSKQIMRNIPESHPVKAHDHSKKRKIKIFLKHNWKWLAPISLILFGYVMMGAINPVFSFMFGAGICWLILYIRFRK